jgi:hypothetical protein
MLCARLPGEPICPAAWNWLHDVVGDGRCPVLDTFWQTETGAIMITPLPGGVLGGGGRTVQPHNPSTHAVRLSVCRPAGRKAGRPAGHTAQNSSAQNSKLIRSAQLKTPSEPLLRDGHRRAPADSLTHLRPASGHTDARCAGTVWSTGISDTKAGSCGLPFFGVVPSVLDDEGRQQLGDLQEGNLCIRSSWPSIARTLHNDHDRFQATYFEHFPVTPHIAIAAVGWGALILHSTEVARPFMATLGWAVLGSGSWASEVCLSWNLGSWASEVCLSWRLGSWTPEVCLSVLDFGSW